MKSTANCTFSESDQNAPTFLVFNVRETCQKDLMSEQVFGGMFGVSKYFLGRYLEV